jgi:DegV family protein with EDD domain
MEYINGKDLYQMFNYGSYNILKERKTLNDINVFPVPDNDTGNNLASTFQAIQQKSVVDENFHDALDTISESALYGARGNSGVIFAQFCNGLRFASKGKAQVTIAEFAEMVSISVQYVYDSISNPVEGTMLTVIKDWANSLIDIVKKNVTTIKHVFESAFQFAKKSLELTKEKLQILKKHNVVDSGAMGFVLFLKGINSYYNKEEIEEVDYEEIEITHTDIHDESVEFRYCTEGLVQANKAFNETELRNILEKYGDSLIIAKGLNIFRIHIHTNNPELVFEELREYGKIITQKVDNMKLDISLTNSKRTRVILTDSIADIPKDILHKENIVQIPINLTVDGIDYFDKLSISNKILFDLIPKSSEYPTTSMPSVKYVENMYKRLLETFDELIVIAVSSNLSGTYRIFSEAANKFNKEAEKIHIIDSLSNSVSQGLLVKKASDLLNDNLSTDKIIKQLEEAKKKAKVFVCLDTIKYATMSGRVPKVVGKIGEFFGMRPIMSLNKEGKGIGFGFAFSKNGITKKIKKLIKKEMNSGGIDSFGLVHCMNDLLLNEYKEIFTKMIGKEPEYVTDVSSATAIHSGIGTVAIGYIRK